MKKTLTTSLLISSSILQLYASTPLEISSRLLQKHLKDIFNFVLYILFLSWICSLSKSSVSKQTGECSLYEHIKTFIKHLYNRGYQSNNLVMIFFGTYCMYTWISSSYDWSLRHNYCEEKLSIRWLLWVKMIIHKRITMSKNDYSLL